MPFVRFHWRYPNEVSPVPKEALRFCRPLSDERRPFRFLVKPQVHSKTGLFIAVGVHHIYLFVPVALGTESNLGI